MKKILILTAAFGDGHNTAARNIRDALEHMCDDVKVEVLDLFDPNFLPGGAKYGDLPALLALGAPGRTWVAGESGDALALAQSQYRAVDAAKNLTLFRGEARAVRSSALEWLLAQDK